jgi:hypothetical protein
MALGLFVRLCISDTYLKAFQLTLTANNVNDTDFIQSVDKTMMDKKPLTVE